MVAIPVLALTVVNAGTCALPYPETAWGQARRCFVADIMLITDDLTPRPDRSYAPPLLAGLLAMALSGAAAAAPMRADLNGVHSWGYQLQQARADLIAASDYDLMVIDYAGEGTTEPGYSPTDMAKMQRKPDGSPRIILAYLSIGEAEDYRAYWQTSWSATPPRWLGAENPEWPGNYAVRYWLPEWQQIIFGTPEAYLDAIIAAGFNGVYLDRIDAFEVRDSSISRSRRMTVMAVFVRAIADYGRRQRPGFIVVGQNAEELLANPTYADAIDGVGKEDLFFGLAGDGIRNSKAELRASLTPLQRFQAAGKPVFIIEYLDRPESKAQARADAAAMGAPLFIGDRELDDVQSR